MHARCFWAWYLFDARLLHDADLPPVHYQKAPGHAKLAFRVCRISLWHSASTRRTITCALASHNAARLLSTKASGNLHDAGRSSGTLGRAAGWRGTTDAIDGLTPALSTNQFDVIRCLKAWCSRPRPEPMVRCVWFDAQRSISDNCTHQLPSHTVHALLFLPAACAIPLTTLGWLATERRSTKRSRTTDLPHPA
jgi:hypothetical protein